MQELNYEKSKHYWSNVSPSVDGMLGGFSCVTTMDIRDSNIFLKKLFQMENGPSTGRVLDCGAGIGRIAENLLNKHFEHVDLLEQDEKFLEKAKQKLQGTNVENFYCCGLQEFTLVDQMYDVIWIQWVLGYLTDGDLIKLMKRCCKMLNKNGVIVVKENITELEEGEFDSLDSSVTRSFLNYCQIFQKADLICIAKRTQKHFPSALYKVVMFALKPANPESNC